MSGFSGQLNRSNKWFQLRVLVGPLPNDRLGGFQPDFSRLLGAGFANPDHAAALGFEGLLIEDKFDPLPAPKVETSTQSEAFFRGIEDEAREYLRLAIQIDDQAGAPLQNNTLRAAGFGERKAGHSFNHWSTGSDGTPRIVSMELRNDNDFGPGLAVGRSIFT
jgi:hypothetical protein